MMRPFTAEQIREAISKLPAEHRGLVAQLCWSAFDLGITVGLMNLARNANPFESLLPVPAEYSMQKSKKR